MRKNKIAVKLFLITTAVFIVFISATLIFQIFFFERYYEQKKQDNFSKGLYELSETLSKETIDENSITDSFKEFDEANSSKTIVVNITQFKKYMADGDILSDPSYMFFAFDRKINGNIMAQLVREWMFFNQSSYLDNLLKDKKVYIYKKHFGRTSSIIGAAPVNNNDTVNNVIFSMVSLQPVGDAVDTMKELYIYVYLFAILIIFVLSTIYSVMISKPLIKLKKAAIKMIELDFSTKCEIKTKDEIGDLGNVLNFLSDKLDTTLSELKESNEKLKEDIEKERELEFMRKEFVAGVSHELKTPITLISGYAEALKDNVAKEQDKDFFVEVIIDESRKMDYLIKDMLELSQLEAGNQKMNIEEFNISELVEFVLKKFSRSIADKNIKIETNIKDTVIMVLGDSMRIEQVLINLISNAMKNIVDGGVLKIAIDINKITKAIEVDFDEKEDQKEHKEKDGNDSIDDEVGHVDHDYPEDNLEKDNEKKAAGVGVEPEVAEEEQKVLEEELEEKVKVKGKEQEDPVEYVKATKESAEIYVISIENEGKHIPENEIDKIWERFYKVDKSRTREIEGTGIGLSIVKNILLLHHSNYGAMNTEKGVKFYFTLNKQI